MPKTSPARDAQTGGTAPRPVRPEPCEWAPEGALIAPAATEGRRLAVVYRSGNEPPQITIDGSGTPVQTVRANGVAVAVVASTRGPRLTPQDVLLVERCL